MPEKVPKMQFQENKPAASSPSINILDGTPSDHVLIKFINLEIHNPILITGL